MVLFGEVLDGAEAARVGLAWRQVPDEELLPVAKELAGRAAAAPRDLLLEVKRTLGDMAAVADHGAAVERELDTQIWSINQPAFQERLAALQKKIRGS
jgi:enoyl-CoA hydratase